MQQRFESFMCPTCCTVVIRPAEGPHELARWLCPGCGLRAEGRPGPASPDVASGLPGWLGDQLVDRLLDPRWRDLRRCLSESVAPALAALGRRTVACADLIDASLQTIVRASRTLDDEGFSESGRRLIALARADDRAALSSHWRARMGNDEHTQRSVAVMLEGPPTASDRAIGRWFGTVFAFVYGADQGDFRLQATNWWEGTWQEPRRENVS